MRNGGINLEFEGLAHPKMSRCPPTAHLNQLRAEFPNVAIAERLVRLRCGCGALSRLSLQHSGPSFRLVYSSCHLCYTQSRFFLLNLTRTNTPSDIPDNRSQSTVSKVLLATSKPSWNGQRTNAISLDREKDIKFNLNRIFNERTKCDHSICLLTLIFHSSFLSLLTYSIKPQWNLRLKNFYFRQSLLLQTTQSFSFPLSYHYEFAVVYTHPIQSIKLFFYRKWINIHKIYRRQT